MSIFFIEEKYWIWTVIKRGAEQFCKTEEKVYKEIQNNIIL